MNSGITSFGLKTSYPRTNEMNGMTNAFFVASSVPIVAFCCWIFVANDASRSPISTVSSPWSCRCGRLRGA
ncbi:Uncharacterised protein [Mycobacteroides abscessus]|nr:Uncharacterised protein [Mycobacteroides abscessus]